MRMAILGSRVLSVESQGDHGMLAARRNLQICVRVYGKQYSNQLTCFCIFFM
jgi:hypothetical protein